jgi:hypothetical protein
MPRGQTFAEPARPEGQLANTGKNRAENSRQAASAETIHRRAKRLASKSKVFPEVVPEQGGATEPVDPPRI